jgi:hypothetical protein
MMEKILKGGLIVALTAFLVIISVFLVTGKFSFDGVTINSKTDPMPNSITADGTARLYVQPDQAQLSLEVVTQGKTVDLVSQENNKKMKAITEAVKGLGVADMDIKTVSYNLYPTYNYDEQPAMIVGYELRQSVNVTIKDLTKTDNIIAASTANGANSISSLNFEVKDRDKYIAQLREQAVSKAKDKLEKLQGLVGFEVVKITSYYEYEQNDYYYPTYGKGMGMVEASYNATPSDISVQAGAEELVFTVNIGYEIK